MPGCALCLWFRRLRTGLFSDLRQLLPFNELRSRDNFLGAATHHIGRSCLFLFWAFGEGSGADRTIDPPCHLILAPIDRILADLSYVRCVMLGAWLLCDLLKFGWGDSTQVMVHWQKEGGILLILFNAPGICRCDGRLASIFWLIQDHVSWILGCHCVHRFHLDGLVEARDLRRKLRLLITTREKIDIGVLVRFSCLFDNFR